MSTLFLINPFSAKVKRIGYEKIENLIQSTYLSNNQPISIEQIDFSTLSQTLQNAPEKGIQKVFAVGGDGTANAIGTQLLHTSLSFGIIPMGSGNGLARSIGFSTHLPLAIKQSVHPQSLWIDTGIFGNHSFLNVAGVGMDAEVVAKFASSKLRGPLPYVYHAANTYFTYKPESYILTIDGTVIESKNVSLINIMNGTQWGYDARISPEAFLSDGWFEVIVMQKIPFNMISLELGKLFIGNITHSKYVKFYKCKKLTIERKSEGNAQVDGEHIMEDKIIHAHILEKSLHLLLPSTLTKQKKSTL